MNEATADAVYDTEAAAIRQCFVLGCDCPVVANDDVVARLVYLVKLTRAAQSMLNYWEEHQCLYDAVRTLLDKLPDLIASAEAEAAAAAQDGRTSDMGHFAWRAKALLEAAEPFALVSRPSRNRQGWWHSWARVIADEVLHTLRQNGRHAGYQKATSPAVIITCDLLALAGTDKNPGAVVEALRDRPRKRVKKKKVTRLRPPE